MTITTIQKIIKIGTSRGVTLPAKQLKALNLSDGDEVEITVRKKPTVTLSDDRVVKVVNDLLNHYKQDFHNLANR